MGRRRLEDRGNFGGLVQRLRHPGRAGHGARGLLETDLAPKRGGELGLAIGVR